MTSNDDLRKLRALGTDIRKYFMLFDREQLHHWISKYDLCPGCFCTACTCIVSEQLCRKCIYSVHYCDEYNDECSHRHLRFSTTKRLCSRLLLPELGNIIYLYLKKPNRYWGFV